MENFGLGLVLSFQDNASSGIESIMGTLSALQESIERMENSATGSIGELEAMASSVTRLGAVATGVGAAITGAFYGIIHSVATTGAEFERTKIAMGQLYGSAEEGRKRMVANMKMAATTPFDMDKFNTLATQMKSINIEADKQLTVVDKFGKKHTQTIAEYIGDLAAMRPDKRFEDASREIIEFLEGNARPLKMSFGLDIPKLLGEGMGATAEERLDQYIRAIAQRAYVGTMQGLNGSWDNIFSNLGDHVKWFVFYITESGIFEQIKKPFSDLNNYLTELMSDESAMKELGKAVSDALGIIVAPAIAVFNVIMRLSGAFVEFSKEHPKLVSMIVGIVGLAGQLIALGGVALVTVGIFYKVRTALRLWAGGMGVVNRVLGIARMGFIALTRSILPVVTTLGLLYYAWRMNLFGLRTLTEGGLKWVSDFLVVLTDALTHIDLVNNKAFMRRDNVELAKQMGIYDFIQKVQEAVILVHTFFDGIVKGVDIASEKIKGLAKDWSETFKGTPLESVFRNPVNSGDQNKQEGGNEQVDVLHYDRNMNKEAQEMGTIIGQNIPYVLGLAAAFRVLTLGFTAIRAVAGGVRAIFEGFQWVFSRLVGLLDPVIRGFTRLRTAFNFGGIGGVVRALSRMSPLFGSIMSVVRPLALAFQIFRASGMGVFTALLNVARGVLVAHPVLFALGLAVMFIINHWEQFKNTASDVWGHIQITISNAWEAIRPRLEILWNKVKELGAVFAEAFPEAAEFVMGFVDSLSVSNDTAQAIFDVLGTAVRVVFDVIVMIIGVAVNSIIGTFTIFVDAAKGVVEFFTKIFQGDIIGAFDVVGKTITTILGDIGSTFSGFVDTIKKGISSLRGEAVESSNTLSTEAADNAIRNMNVNHRNEALGDILLPTAGGVNVVAAEAGVPEAFIPINDSQRSKWLWSKTGEMLGMFNIENVGEQRQFTAPVEIPRQDNSIISSIGGMVESAYSQFRNLTSANVVPPEQEEDISVSVDIPLQQMVDRVIPVIRNAFAGQSASPSSTYSGSSTVNIQSGAVQITIEGMRGDTVKTARELAQEIKPYLDRLGEIGAMRTRRRGVTA